MTPGAIVAGGFGGVGGRTDLVITSPANARLKSLVALRRRRVREETGTTLVEGFEELSVALAAGVRPAAVYYCPELFSPAGRAGVQDIGEQTDALGVARSRGAEMVQVSRAAFEKAAYRDGPDGVLAVVPAVSRSVGELTRHTDDVVLICQGVEKPGNLGAMLRTADAAGVSAVVAADPVTDWGNPNVVRASKGAVFALDVATGLSEETLAWCRGHGIRLVVTTPEADVTYTDADLTGPIAVVVGSEKHGADASMLAAADLRVGIPMAGKVNSLNVSVAAAVVLYEAVRQRRSG